MAHETRPRAQHNVQPGKYGEPMLHHDFTQVVLDALHMAELNLGKIAWKHAILNNASDDARDAMSAQLKAWRHPLDCRRKDDNRQKALKWFTGEKWHSFCAGTSGSPGGPVAIAMLTLIMAEDMQLNGVGTVAAAPVVAAPVVAAAPVAGRGRGRSMVTTARATLPIVAPVAPLPATRQTKHIPTALELVADPEDLRGS